ncbi:MAG: class I SAM-dependent methyltransferase [Flavobacteriales bacterium]|nr:class I SAM-dependent methyltransferase [Flavobacteriales bacterium]
MNTITNIGLLRTLQTLHTEAAKELPKLLKGLAKGIFTGLKPEDMRETFMAIGADQGQEMYDMIVAAKARSIVEYGTSFGLSTLYLAAAAEQTCGKVITTELLGDKADIAQAHFDQAKVSHLIDLRRGDALKTLSNIDEPVHFFFMDGWSQINIDLLKMLEPNFVDGTIVLLDNANMPGSKATKKYFEVHPQFETSGNVKGSRTYKATYQK